MNVNHYIGFDVHKKSISYCVKTAEGTIVEEGTLRATHPALREWAEKRREPWHGAMEATLFSGFRTGRGRLRLSTATCRRRASTSRAASAGKRKRAMRQGLQGWIR
jgi:hypothetical protein